MKKIIRKMFILLLGGVLIIPFGAKAEKVTCSQRKDILYSETFDNRSLEGWEFQFDPTWVADDNGGYQLSLK